MLKSNLNLKIYIANIRAYNSGKLQGKWINLPMEHDQLVKEMEFFGNCDYAIHDIESSIDISEYIDIFSFNAFLLELIELNNNITLSDLETIYRFFINENDIKKIVENEYTIIENIGNYYDLAKLCIQEEEYYHILPFDMDSFLSCNIGTRFLCEQQISQEMEVDDRIYIDKDYRTVLFLHEAL